MDFASSWSCEQLVTPGQLQCLQGQLARQCWPLQAFPWWASSDTALSVPIVSWTPRYIGATIFDHIYYACTWVAAFTVYQALFYALCLPIHLDCCCLVAQLCPTLWDRMDCWPARLLCPWNSPGKNTGLRCHFLLQRIFPTQGSNPRLLHCRQSPVLQVDSFWLSHFIYPRMTGRETEVQLVCGG